MTSSGAVPPSKEAAFSHGLEQWLAAPGRKTIGDLGDAFEEKSFAVAFLLLMSLPALPLPTGGVTHVFELVTALLALELMGGRRTMWLPKRWRDHEMGALTQRKAIPFIVRRVRWFERFSRPRGRSLLEQALVLRALGAIVLLFTVAAFLAPPFSGLDTLPALGVVIVALAMILGDALFVLMGVVVGAVGIALELLLGSAVARLV